MRISKNVIRLCNIACAVLMIALLVLQFLPFWTFPACNCTTKCEKLDFNANCPMCSAHYKTCVHIPLEELTAGTDRLDYSKEWTVSIQQFTWTPTFDSCDGATEYFQKMYNTDDYEFMVKDIVLMPILVLFGTAFGAYFCLFKSNKALSGIFPLIVGIAGVVGYLTLPVFQLGAMWQLHMALAAVVLVISLVPMAECIFRVIDWCTPSKAQ